VTERAEGAPRLVRKSEGIVHVANRREGVVIELMRRKAMMQVRRPRTPCSENGRRCDAFDISEFWLATNRRPAKRAGANKEKGEGDSTQGRLVEDVGRAQDQGSKTDDVCTGLVRMQRCEVSNKQGRYGPGRYKKGELDIEIKMENSSE
jgi:hypothetical protein